MPGKRRSMADLLAEQRAIEDDPAGTTALAVVPDPQPAAAVTVITTAVIPDPHSPTGHGELSAAEESDLLAVCEMAIDNLRLAFAAAGKALAVIQAGRLYRGEYDTFEAYVESRWDMSRAQAYRLIEAWPLADRLSLSPMGDKLNERQVRELVPLARDHGDDAAELVYQTVAGGVHVTAAVLHDVVGILPAGYFNAGEAVRQIRAYLAGQVPAAPPPPPADPVQALHRDRDRFLATLRGDAVKAARAASPGAVREVIASVRQALDELDREAAT